MNSNTRDMTLYLLWHYRFDQFGNTITRDALPYRFRSLQRALSAIDDMRPALQATYSNPLCDDVILLIRYTDDYIAYWEML